MSWRAGAVLFLAMATLFLVANRAAYKSYFLDDELDNLSWAPSLSFSTFAEGLVTPQFLRGNFRPVGHFYFAVMGKRFGLDFPKYLFPIHALHLLNVWLVWLVARRLGASLFAAAAGAVFFAFHMAVFDVLWKPMYVFDLLCGTFCLASLFFYMRRWLIPSFIMFWLAYKSKELAVMLPAVLAIYEYWFGKRRWKPLLPFFAVSLCFGLQGLLFNPNRHNDYAFDFTASKIFNTAWFYGDSVLLFPFAGVVLLAVPMLTRDRRVWFGLAAALLLCAPLLLLPNRAFSAYCYVPLIGLAIACAGIAGSRHRKLVVLFFLLWIGWNEFNLRLNRRRTLAVADEYRSYVQALGQAAREHPDANSFIYDGAPFSMRFWGIRGALRIVTGKSDIQLTSIEDKSMRNLLDSNRVVILSWNAPLRQMSVTAHRAGEPDAPYIRMNQTTPLWQLGRGWFGLENRFRWTEPKAGAKLYRPAGARRFEVVVNISPDMIREIGHTTITVSLDGRTIGTESFDKSGWHTVSWNLEPAPAGNVQVEFKSDPVYRPPAPDSRVLGMAIGGFGFVEKENP
jgi:hypothetical protein